MERPQRGLPHKAHRRRRPFISKQEVHIMSTNEIEAKCRELRQLQNLIAEAEH